MDDVKKDPTGGDDAERVKRMSLEEAFLEYRGYIEKTCAIMCRKWIGCPFIDDDFRDDLVSQVFERFPHAYQRFDGKAKFTTYLHSIIRNTLVDMVKKESRHHGVGQVFPETLADHSPGPGEEGIDPSVLAALEEIMTPRRDGGAPGGGGALFVETDRILREGIRELEKPVRVAVATMYFIDRIPQTAVARELKRSQSAVSDQVNLARRHLLDYIARRFPEAGDLVAKIKRLAAEGGGKDG